MREAGITLNLREFGSLAELPQACLGLFGADAYSTLAWYRTALAAAVPQGTVARFLVLEQAGEPAGLFPLMRAGGANSNLATPYTCLWQPLLEAGAGDALLTAMGERVGRRLRATSVTRFDALDETAAWLAPFLAGAGAAGLRSLPFKHFGNWFCDVEGLGWAEYLARRPGALRETIKRRTKKLMDADTRFTLVRDAADLETALEAYEHVYARSWKDPEPYAAFNPALMRACAADATLRLGLIHRAGEPIAAQFWIVRDGWAGVQKLAHTEAAKALAPGTVLTALMIRSLLEGERIDELDFGRGDDAYKRDWTGSRRQRIGVLLVNPRTIRGAYEVIKRRVRRG